MIPKDARPYFRDVFDHFSRVAENIETYRDVVQNAIDAHLSVQANRMNETMKRLTLISTVMLPLTFVASFYGMNFSTCRSSAGPTGSSSRSASWCRGRLHLGLAQVETVGMRARPRSGGLTPPRASPTG